MRPTQSELNIVAKTRAGEVVGSGEGEEGRPKTPGNEQ